jgi:hypothetical protein
MKKTIVEMTIDEFKAELARLRAVAMHIKPTGVGEGRSTNRSYAMNKRGNFHGNNRKLWRF